ncbi:MAG: Smr/MutS family protein [Flavobacteriaceae bacterium]
MARRSGGRNEEDATLWRKVVENVEPLRRKRPRAVPAGEAPAKPEAAPKVRKEKVAKQAPAAPATTRTNIERKPAAPSAAIDSKLLRKVGKDRTPIESVLDLHGMRQAEAHRALDLFIRSGHARGFRVVMVITGKGGAEGKGVLRRSVPDWLDHPALAPLVVGWSAAHRHRGGDGAIYIHLRQRGKLRP